MILRQVHAESSGQREIHPAWQSWLHKGGLAAEQVKQEEVKTSAEAKHLQVPQYEHHCRERSQETGQPWGKLITKYQPSDLSLVCV